MVFFIGILYLLSSVESANYTIDGVVKIGSKSKYKFNIELPTDNEQPTAERRIFHVNKDLFPSTSDEHVANVKESSTDTEEILSKKFQVTIKNKYNKKPAYLRAKILSNSDISSFEDDNDSDVYRRGRIDASGRDISVNYGTSKGSYEQDDRYGEAPVFKPLRVYQTYTTKQYKKIKVNYNSEADWKPQGKLLTTKQLFGYKNNKDEDLVEEFFYGNDDKLKNTFVNTNKVKSLFECLKNNVGGFQQWLKNITNTPQKNHNSEKDWRGTPNIKEDNLTFGQFTQNILNHDMEQKICKQQYERAEKKTHYNFFEFGGYESIFKEFFDKVHGNRTTTMKYSQTNYTPFMVTISDVNYTNENNSKLMETLKNDSWHWFQNKWANNSWMTVELPKFTKLDVENDLQKLKNESHISILHLYQELNKLPNRIKDNATINHFIKQIRIRTLRMFKDLEKKSTEYRWKRKMKYIARSYEDKFNEFLRNSKQHTFRTRLAGRKVILNAINVSTRIATRLIDFMADDMEKRGLIYSNLTPQLFRSEINKEGDYELKRACQKFGVCRSYRKGFTDFIVETMVTMLSVPNERFKPAFNNLIEAAKNADYGFSEDVKIGIERKVNYIGGQDVHVQRGTLMILKNLIANRNSPVKLYYDTNPTISKIPLTLAFLEVINTLDEKVDSNNKTIAEWNRVQQSVNKWAVGRLDNSNNTMVDFMTLLAKSIKDVDGASRDIITQNVRKLFT